ncbi:hypothetical protein [Wolbachia endosymbiont of Chironomus riparius]|uniref:hypothetical protein n=1 Tax=Wolbachia endosymbiont of Chironomus riparius TaxID=2883238 RepID=UPI0020A1DC4E|nr:hypothetical protein [Wolbachia endosymbiont of Chironomus riparius]
MKKQTTKNDDYCPFVKEVFKEMFQYAGAEVPHDSILEELITNCNQAGYEGGLCVKLACIFHECGLIIGSPEKKIDINCVNPSYVEIKSDMDSPIFKYENPEKEMCSLTSELKFTLESNEQESDKNVKYKDGKLLLTVPNELKNYTIGEKKLFDVIKEYFKAFCKKLGFNFEMKIEHNFTKPSANGHLEEVKQPMQSINQKENYQTTTWYVE